MLNYKVTLSVFVRKGAKILLIYPGNEMFLLNCKCYKFYIDIYICIVYYFSFVCKLTHQYVGNFSAMVLCYSSKHKKNHVEYEI